MNTTVFGQPSAREALEKHVMNTENEWNLCAGGDECKPWQRTIGGRARRQQLVVQYRAHLDKESRPG